MAVFDWMAEMAIGAAGGSSKVFGTKPQIAGYTETDPGTEAARAVESNTANMPGIQAFLEKILPGYGEMLKQGSQTTLSMLRGEIPDDVQGKVRRTSAYKSLMGGFGGSGMSKTLTARDFGLTSMDIMEKGANSAQRWSSIATGNVAPFTVTGKDQTDATFKNNLYKQAVDQFRFNVDAAPDPGAAGLFNTIGVIGGTAASFGLAAMGGSNNTPPVNVQSGNYGNSPYGNSSMAQGANNAGQFSNYRGWGG